MAEKTNKTMKKILLILVVFLSLDVNSQTISPEKWNEAPTATFINQNRFIIKGDSTYITIESTMKGENGWDIVYSDGTNLYKIKTQESIHRIVVSPNKSTIYTLININNGYCDGIIKREKTAVIIKKWLTCKGTI